MDKIDLGYGQMIQDNQVLKIVFYPTMVLAHGFTVYPDNLERSSYLYF